MRRKGFQLIERRPLGFINVMTPLGDFNSIPIENTNISYDSYGSIIVCITKRANGAMQLVFGKHIAKTRPELDPYNGGRI